MVKKTVFKDPAAYSVAMSKDTGCIVMVRTNGQQATVMGSLDRETSLKFCKELLEWMPEAIRMAPDEPAEKLGETLN
jgi:hypothetical protein